MWRFWWLPLAAGCGPELMGWWDIVRVEVSRDGASDVREDAGFLTWQDAPYGSFTMGLSYVYDPLAVELVPDPDPDLVDYGPHPDDVEISDDEPELTLNIPATNEDWIWAEFDIVELRRSTMRLEAPSASDGSTWVWELER